MTTEQKAKAYDEVLKQIKEYTPDENGFITIYPQEIFPELTESKDERIRKWIIGVLSTYEHDKNLIDDAIAWLEKQKTSEEALQYLRENHSSSEMSDFQAAMNIAVAKAYDKGYNDGLEKQGEQKPTDNEMKEALRTEYEKGRADAIVEIQNPVDCIDCTNSKGCINCEDGNMKETLVQKTAWSEEDECYMSECIGAIATKDGWSFEEKRKTKHWLKSLKERIKK